MKHCLQLILVTLIFSSIQVVRAQDPCYTQKKPLSIFAYRKMMRNHYSLTILGTQSPVSGFKVETNKPTITLKGNIFSNRTKELLVNLELTGGLQNDLMQVFAGNKLNGFFKSSLGFNILFPSGNNAKYVLNDALVQSITRKKVCENQEEIAKQIDTMLVLSAIKDYMLVAAPTLSDMVKYLIVNAAKDEYTIDKYSEFKAGKYHRPIPDKEGYYKNLIIEMIKKYGGDATKTADAMYLEFMTKIVSTDDKTIKVSKMLSDINRVSKFKTDRSYKYDLKNDFEIEAYKDIWTSKRIAWLNISIAGSNSTFKTFNDQTKILSDSSSFIPALSITYNFLKKWSQPNKYFYIRTGAVVKRVSSIIDLKEFEYKKETVITVSPTEQLKTEKKGTAYQGVFKHGAGIEIPIEMYYAPWNQPFVPGLYAKAQYSYGSAWINKNKLSLDLGVIWNVTNNEKDSKNLLTIIPYLGWLNFLKEYKEISKTTEKKLSDLFYVGVKFGIPINLGK